MPPGRERSSSIRGQLKMGCELLCCSSHLPEIKSLLSKGRRWVKEIKPRSSQMLLVLKGKGKDDDFMIVHLQHCAVLSASQWLVHWKGLCSFSMFSKMFLIPSLNAAVFKAHGSVSTLMRWLFLYFGSCCCVPLPSMWLAFVEIR